MRIASLCHAMAAVAHDLAVPYLPVFARLEQASLWQYEVARYDGSHPRQGGYEELAALVQEWPAWGFTATP